MTHLLDANALIALLWPAHEHHRTMLDWFDRNAARGWATNPLTQAAFVRVVSQPAFAGRPISLGAIADLLLRNLAHEWHQYLSIDFGFDQVLGACSAGLLGHRQVTDAWMLACAVRHGVRLLTLDRGVEQLLRTAAERRQHIASPLVD